MRWFTSPHVILALIMLVLLFYMVIIPLYRMVATSLTWQPHDLTRVPDAVVGKPTLFHYIRMLTGVLGKIYMYTRCSTP
jgi:iron(III) transport system permease protein